MSIASSSSTRSSPRSSFDVVIIGGGPAGLSAALVLGRGRKRVLVVDGGAPRNAPAAHMNGFVSQDGTPPKEFRRIAGGQLAKYPAVVQRRGLASSIEGEAGALRVRIASEAGATGAESVQVAETVEARRVILCNGMIDELPELPGYRELWGHSIVQCPYCHGWEAQGKTFGCLLPADASGPYLDFPLFLKGWTDDVVVLSSTLPEEARARFEAAGVRVEARPLRRLIARPGEHGAELEAAEVGDEEGDHARVEMSMLFAKPKQRQTPLVASLGLALDDHGFVRVDEHKATSRPGIHAAGDLTTMQQGALVAAAAGAQAAYMINHALTMEDATQSSTQSSTTTAR
jgi:thioredoxin reductase